MSIVIKYIFKYILYVDGVIKFFDGFKVLNSLLFMVKLGELCVIIGFNGVGKIIMMDVIIGKLKFDEGDVFFCDLVDLIKFDEVDIVNMGIGCKF